MTTTTLSSFLKRAVATAALSATLAAPGVVGFTAGTAEARPMREGSIAKQCRTAGNWYQTFIYEGSRHSTCSGQSSTGARWTSHYIDGEWVGVSNDWPARIPQR